MAYTEFDETLPNINSSPQLVWSEINANFQALSHMLGMGAIFNWNGAPSVGGGSAQQPDSYQWINNDDINQILVFEFTWGVSGPEEGLLTQVVVKYSSDGGSIVDTVKTLTLSYSEVGAFPVMVWT